MGITANGVEVITEEQYFNQILSDYKLVFPEMSTSPSNMLVILARIWARNENRRDYDLVELFNNLFVSHASGKNLDRIVGTAGLYRSKGLYSGGTIVVTSNATSGTDYTQQVILGKNELLKVGEKLYRINEENDILFPTPLNQVTSMELNIVANEIGSEYDLPKNTIMNTVTPKLHIKDIIVKDGIIGGEYIEGDAELRNRFYERMNQNNNSSLLGIIDKVGQIVGVDRVSGEENNTDSDKTIINAPAGKPDKLTPHSFIIYTHSDGNVDEEIAKVILESKPTGIEAIGEVSKKVTINGREWEVNFSRFSLTELWFDIEVNPKEGSTSIDIPLEIRHALNEYVTTQNTINRFDTTVWLAQKFDWIDGFDKFNFGIGDKFIDDGKLHEDDVNVGIGEIFSSDKDDITKVRVTVVKAPIGNDV